MISLALAPPALGLHAGHRTAVRRRVAAPARCSHDDAIDALAARAASAMREGRAHVEPAFLSGDALDVARANMESVLATVPEAGDGDMESIQTDLLSAEFQQSLGASLPFASLLSQLDELRSALARHAARALLDGGGFHLMRYPPGAKFMRHVDEDPTMFEPRRNSISFLLYLTPDDWSDDDGGSLIIYDSTAGDEGRRVQPVAGSLVVYDSTLEHEVTATRRPRFLISGRFRELDADWSERRARRA